MQETFGTRLQAARKRAGYRSQLTFANALNVSDRTIRNYEINKTHPDAEMLQRMRRLLGPFDVAGDPVEVAVRNSELTEDRQDTVVGFYKRNLREQREERREERGA